jgi:hypothetical protein
MELGLVNWNHQAIELEFYYDSKNIEFKQNYIVDFGAMGYQHSVKHILHEEREQKYIFVLVLTFEKDAEGRYTITAHKEKEYENSTVDKLRLTVQEISCSFGFANNEVTLECSKLTMIREKGIEMQDIDLQLEKMLIR